MAHRRRPVWLSFMPEAAMRGTHKQRSGRGANRLPVARAEVDEEDVLVLEPAVPCPRVSVGRSGRQSAANGKPRPGAATGGEGVRSVSARACPRARRSRPGASARTRAPPPCPPRLETKHVAIAPPSQAAGQLPRVRTRAGGSHRFLPAPAKRVLPAGGGASRFQTRERAHRRRRCIP